MISVLRSNVLIVCIGFLILVIPTKSFGDGALLTVEDVLMIYPSARPEYAEALSNASEQFEAAGINTRLRMAHFIAQVMTETGGLKRLDENMNYSYRTLLRVFSRRTISDAKAREIAGKPKEIANWVYGARLGNLGRDTDDGWNFRGSGFIQLTGRTNFRSRGAEIGLPLEDQPELARQPKEGLLAALAYWTSRNINDAADDNDRYRVRVLVNGPAAHGYDQSIVWFNRGWSRVFREKEAHGFEGDIVVAQEGSEEEEKLFDNILSDSGIVPKNLPNTEDGRAQKEDALRAFQNELGLPETGVLDEATKEALLDPREWRHSSRPEEPGRGRETDLEASVSFDLLQADPRELEPFEGSGATVENTSITAATVERLSDAGSVYPEYEMGERSRDPDTWVPFSVIGEDEREPVINTLGFPDRAIVQILFETDFGSSLCTGSMVSADTVLTAAHCIHSGTDSGTTYRDFRIIPGRNVALAPFGECNAVRAYVLNGWVSSISPEEARYFDMGALKLDCAIGNLTGWLGVEGLSSADVDQGTVVQGYAADKVPAGRQWISVDSLRILWELKGFYQNDTFGGTSGSPVFLSDNRAVQVGVHTNGLHGVEPWSSHNAFTRFTPDRLRAIDHWIQN